MRDIRTICPDIKGFSQGAAVAGEKSCSRGGQWPSYFAA